MSDCRLCLGIQSLPASDLVQEVVAKKEMSLETLLTGMRDSMVLGWTLREMAGRREGTLCEEHAAQVKELAFGEEGEG
jgi:hypothetical protein